MPTTSDKPQTLAEQIRALEPPSWMTENADDAMLGGFQEGLEAAAALADAATPAEQVWDVRQAVRVKPLVWFEAQLPSRGGGKWQSSGYTIRKIEGLFLVDFAGDSKSDWHFTTLESAQAAAQADYAARITAAIEPDPTPALGWRAMQTAAERAAAKITLIGSDAQQQHSSLETSLAIRHAIIALPGPTDADLDRDAMNRPVVQELVDAANDVCNDSITPASDMGFARSVQRVCSAKARLRAALAALTAWRDSQRPPSEYEQKLAAMKKDFPNGI